MKLFVIMERHCCVWNWKKVSISLFYGIFTLSPLNMATVSPTKNSHDAFWCTSPYAILETLWSLGAAILWTNWPLDSISRMHMSTTMGRSVLWAFTRVVRSQLYTLRTCFRFGLQSLGTEAEHCLCTFKPQSVETERGRRGGQEVYWCNKTDGRGGKKKKSWLLRWQFGNYSCLLNAPVIKLILLFSSFRHIWTCYFACWGQNPFPQYVLWECQLNTGERSNRRRGNLVGQRPSVSLKSPWAPE